MHHNHESSMFCLSAEYDCNFELKHKKEFAIPDHLMIHDWAFTDNHYVIIANRIKIDALGKEALQMNAKSEVCY